MFHYIAEYKTYFVNGKLFCFRKWHSVFGLPEKTFQIEDWGVILSLYIGTRVQHPVRVGKACKSCPPCVWRILRQRWK